MRTAYLLSDMNKYSIVSDFLYRTKILYAYDILFSNHVVLCRSTKIHTTINIYHILQYLHSYVHI